ncbi:hypothetical protein pb186bvf_010981 [Paramecium bursaria]
MQVFNSILCRQLDYSSLNPFQNIFNNSLFWIIQIFTVLTQYALIEFAYDYVKVRKLTLEEHLISIILGAGGIIMGVLFKLIPENWWRKVKLFKELEIPEEQMDGTLTSHLRRKSSVRLHSRQSNITFLFVTSSYDVYGQQEGRQNCTSDNISFCQNRIIVNHVYKLNNIQCYSVKLFLIKQNYNSINFSFSHLFSVQVT